MNIKSIVSNIILAVVSNAIYQFIINASIIAVIFNFFDLKTTILFSLLLVCVWIIYLILRKNPIFFWNHYYSESKHTIILLENGNGNDSEQIKIKPLRNFNYTVNGSYYWEDINVEQIKVNSNEALIDITYTDENGLETNITNTNQIVVNKSIYADYTIKYLNNKCDDLFIDVDFKYDENMKTEYYVEVTVPINKLILEVKFHQSIKVKNIRKKIIALYGDKTELYNKVLKPKKDNSNPNLIVYRFVIYNPKVLYKYQIDWSKC